MRILVLNTDAFGGRHGIALYNRDLITALCEHPDSEEVVAMPILMPENPKNLPNKLTYITESTGSKFSYVRAAIKVARQSPNFDLIICSHVRLLSVAFLLRLWIKAPIILQIYGIEIWQPSRHRINNYLASKVDAFWSISKLTTTRFLSWKGNLKNRGSLLPNAIHSADYGTDQKNMDLIQRYRLQGRTIIMTLSRITLKEKNLKGFEEIISVLPNLAQEIPNITYLIAGDGDGKGRLKRIAESTGVADRVVFTGYVKEEEKADHLRLADVYVAASNCEGFGFVLLEAMACGVPVMASKLDGSQEAIQHGKLGELVDPRNPDEIKQAIIKLLKEPRNIPEGLEYFSFSNFKQRLYQVIDKYC
jgi:glycosyltransferase involved in cell wall biosynthesis